MEWNEWFTFDIGTGQEPLIIQLANRDVYGTYDILGECSINLYDLRDQMKHNQWYQLVPPLNSPSNHLY